MRPLQGSAPVRPLPLRQQVFVNPFGKFGRPVQRAVDRPLDDFLCQTLGQGIDRLHRPDAVGVLEGGDEIRMGHLPAAAEFVDPAADDPDLADRIGFFEPVRFRVEEHQGHEAGFVRTDHAVRPFRRAGRLVRIDPYGDRRDFAEHGLGYFRRVAAIDQAGRQGPQEIDDPRPRHPLDQLLQPGADAGQGIDIAKDREQGRGTHKAECPKPWPGVQVSSARQPSRDNARRIAGGISGYGSRTAPAPPVPPIPRGVGRSLPHSSMDCCRICANKT